MDMSTDDYLKKFRQGEYVWIKDWIYFLSKQYHAEGFLEADSVVDLIAFELINHEITGEDLATHLPIIFAIVSSPSFGHFFGELQCLMINLLSATLQCKVYFEHNLIDFYKCESHEDLDIKSICQFMKRDNGKLSHEASSQALGKLYDLLGKDKKDYSETIKILEDKMHVLTPIQGTCENYLRRLKALRPPEEEKEENKFLAIRIGVAYSLKDYTLNQYILNEENRDKIISYVAQLRSLEPYPWEEAFFVSLTGGSFFKRFSQYCAVGLKNLRFFTLKQLHIFTSTPEPEEPPQLEEPSQLK